MTPNDCLLVAICFMAASLLIRVTEPVWDYILAVIAVFLYYVLGGLLFPFTLVFLLPLFVGTSLATFIYDVESNRWKLAATAFGMLTLTLLIGLVRLLWSYVQHITFGRLIWIVAVLILDGVVADVAGNTVRVRKLQAFSRKAI